MNNVVILTREQAEKYKSFLWGEVHDMRDDGDESFEPEIDSCTKTAYKIDSQLNSDSIQEAWQKMNRVRWCDGEYNLVRTSDVLNFLKTIGINID